MCSLSGDECSMERNGRMETTYLQFASHDDGQRYVLYGKWLFFSSTLITITVSIRRFSRSWHIAHNALRKAVPNLTGLQVWLFPWLTLTVCRFVLSREKKTQRKDLWPPLGSTIHLALGPFGSLPCQSFASKFTNFALPHGHDAQCVAQNTAHQGHLLPELVRTFAYFVPFPRFYIVYRYSCKYYVQ